MFYNPTGSTRYGMLLPVEFERHCKVRAKGVKKTRGGSGCVLEITNYTSECPPNVRNR
jgi:hypothetical protein